MSAKVTWSVTQGSASAKFGSTLWIGSFQEILPSPTRVDMTVAPIGLDSDASWKTVSASTFSVVPTLRTP